MIWIFELIAECIFGAELCGYLLNRKYSMYFLLSIGIPVGMASSTLIFFITSIFVGINATNVAANLCIIIYGIIVFHTFNVRKTKISITLPDLPTIAFSISSFILSIFLLKGMYLYPKNNLQNNVYQNFQEEYMIMKSFSVGVNSGFTNIFKIRHPICYKCVCRSRWLTALHSAMMIKGFASDKTAIIYPSFLYIFSFLMIHMQLAHLLLKSITKAVLSSFVFVFAGGLGFLSLLVEDFEGKYGIDFVHIRGTFKTEWLHPVLDYLIPYRPSQLAIGLMLTLISILIQVGNKAHRKRDLVLCGIISGLLLPVYFQVCVASIAYTVIYLFYLPLSREDKKERKNGLTDVVFYLIPIGIISAIPLLQFFPRSSNYRLLSYGEISNPLIKRGIFFAPIYYWLENLGVFAIIALLVGPFVIDKKLWQIYFPSLIIFIFFNFFRMQPLTTQNIIVFYPCWLSVASIVFIAVLSWLANYPKSEESKGIALAWATLFFACATLSALTGFHKLRNHTTQILLEEFDAADWIIAHTSTKDVFITDVQKPFTVVPHLTGRVVFASRADILENYGKVVDWKNVEQSKLFDNMTDKNIAKKVKYALLSRNTILETEGWKLEYQNSMYMIYSRVFE